MVNDTRVNGVRAPLAIDIDDIPSPTLSWRVSGGAQVAYRVLVSLDASFTPPLWDSGAVSSPQLTCVYAGPALSHGSSLFWSVSSSSDGAVWSSPATSTFGTGLDSVAWAAAASDGGWLGSCTQADASPALRLSFALDAAPIVEARAYASALGLYALSINGARTGGGREAVLTPGWATVPTTRVAADAYDVTSMLGAGENVVGMTLGQGEFGSMRSRRSAVVVLQHCARRSQPRFISTPSATPLTPLSQENMDIMEVS